MTGYCVVRHALGPYSVLPVSRPVPAGWVDVGFAGTKEQCLAYIAGVWDDLRPLSGAAS